MQKIVVPHNLGLTEKQEKELMMLGEVKFFKDAPKTIEEWLKRVQGADIIFTESFGFLENLYNIKSCFLTYPFVSIGKIDKTKLKKNDVVIANCPGANKTSVTERILTMTLNLLREFPLFVNNNSLVKTDDLPKLTLGLEHKNILILGVGNIGTSVGKVLATMGANVYFYRKGDDLYEKSKNTAVIINCLPLNDTTKNLLDDSFFYSLKKGVYYISSSRAEIHDIDAIINAVGDGILAGVADDCASEKVGDIHNTYYQKLLPKENFLITPHIAWATDNAIFNGNQICIENIKSWIQGNPQNVVS